MNICRNFSQNSGRYIGLALVKEALDLLANSDLKAKIFRELTSIPLITY